MQQDKVNTGPASSLGLSEIPCGIINHHLVEHLVLIAVWRNIQMWWPATHMAIASITSPHLEREPCAGIHNVLLEHLCAYKRVASCMLREPLKHIALSHRGKEIIMCYIYLISHTCQLHWCFA